MKIVKKPLSVAQARKALDRAKARGRVDEIRQASGRLAGAVSSERASVRRAVTETAQAVADQLRVIERAPPTLTPAQRGAQTRQLRQLERQALAARVAAERQTPPQDPRIAVLLDAWRRLRPGQDCFGGAYEVIDPCQLQSAEVYWYGVDVTVPAAQPLAAEYRWTGRTLTPQAAAGDLTAMLDVYKKFRPPLPPPRKQQSPCEIWQEAQEFSLAQAKKGLDFETIIAVVRK